MSLNTGMRCEACEFPQNSALDRAWVQGAYFWDAYRADLAHPEASVTQMFQAIFAHHPLWMKQLLIARNAVARRLGLESPSVNEILNPHFQTNYCVGDTIGVWPIFALTETELIAGRNNSHLDFRLSILKVTTDGQTRVVVSTVCSVHNGFGKVYLFFVVPFHRWGVRLLIRRAQKAGRL